MKALSNSWLALTFVGVFILLSLSSLAVSDKLVSSMLEDIRTISLSRDAAIGTEDIEIELSRMRQQALYLTDDLARLKERHVPTVAELRELQKKHRLRLIQIERISSPGSDRSGQGEYAAVLNGTVGALTRFLVDLESDYVVRGGQVSLKTANSDGSTVNLHFTLVVREE